MAWAVVAAFLGGHGRLAGALYREHAGARGATMTLALRQYQAQCRRVTGAPHAARAAALFEQLDVLLTAVAYMMPMT